MFSDFESYKTPKLQHAQMLLALLQLALKRAGMVEDAHRLEGIDLTNTEMAKVALEILRAMNVEVREVQGAHHRAVQAVQEALQSSSVPQHVAN